MTLLEKNKALVNQAVKILKSGGIIAFATETVYALACDASNDLAVQRIYRLKKRQKEKPIAVFVKNLSTAKKIFVIDKTTFKIAKEFMPGPLTIVTSKKPDIKNISPISDLLNQGSKIIGFRIPDDEFCLKLLKKFNGVIAATSANISGEKPAINYRQVQKYFGKKIDLIIDGKSCKKKRASTVIKINSDQQIEILRKGPITKKQINDAIAK